MRAARMRCAVRNAVGSGDARVRAHRLVEGAREWGLTSRAGAFPLFESLIRSQTFEVGCERKVKVIVTLEVDYATRCQLGQSGTFKRKCENEAKVNVGS